MKRLPIRMGFVLTAMVLPVTSLARPAGGQYVLRMICNAQPCTVSVNGRPFNFKRDDNTTVPITSALHAGPNKVHVSYRAGKYTTFIGIAYARDAGQYRTLFDLQLDNIFLPNSGDLDYTIVADGDRGAGRKSTGSANDQTLLRTDIAKGEFAVSINGTFLGDYTGQTKRDVSNYVKPGLNTITIHWKKQYGPTPPVGAVSVAYAEQKDQFRQIFLWDTGSGLDSHEGSKTLTFQAGR